MLYLSQVLGSTVENVQHERIGRLIDVLVATAMHEAPVFPRALLIEGEEDQPWRVPAEVLERHDGQFRLLIPVAELTVYTEEASEETSLAHHVLDKQVIDVERKKAVRVNDICFDDHWRILGVDNSNLGLIRRLAPHWLLGGMSQQLPATLIPWDQVELLGHQVTPTPGTHLSRSPSGQLAELHPADIAEIVQQLTPHEGARIIEGLDTETAADTMEEMDTERQRHILENIQSERAADILETMEPDEAADLLARLPEERAQELLNLMTPEESEEVQELLEYEDNTAGGLMTTEYLTLNQTRTVADALTAIRQDIQENDVRIAYIYCVADELQDEQHILGVISLWELLAALPTQPLQELMETDVITVQPDSSPHEVAEIMAKYNLLAVPVVSSEGILEGIVTVDDALDVLLPPEKRHRQNRMY